MSESPLRLVIVTTQGSPAGAAYLSRLAGIESLEIMVLCEVHAGREAETARILAERFGERAPKENPTIKDLCAARRIRLDKFPSCNHPDALKAVAGFGPCLGLLAGSGIVKNDFLALPRFGTLNCHPGILPRYRGCTCVEWAIYEDEPVGATCHFVTGEIDAGDILAKKIMPVSAGDSYVDIRLRMFYFQAELAAECVRGFLKDREASLRRVEKFDLSQARYYKPIPPEAMQAVLAKLETGRYSCVPERP